MILILGSWFVLFGCFLTTGIAVDCWLKLNAKNIFLKILTGMAAQTVLLTSCAFFFPLHEKVLAGNLLLPILLFFSFRMRITDEIKAFSENLKTLSAFEKAILALVLVSALLQSAQAPGILDNESYYVQTIKWLNEYGFVNGLANLNVAFGQTSPWHILQAGFNCSFFTERLNDLNGFLLVCATFFLLAEAKTAQNRWLYFLPFLNVLLFQFLSAPSPDFPLIVIGQIVFLLFLKPEKQLSEFKMLAVLTIFLISIKITFAPFLLLPLLEIFRRKKGLLFFSSCSVVFGSLWVLKNAVLFGYPIFPLPYFVLNADWTIPIKLLENLNNMVHNHEFIGIKGYQDFSVLDKFLVWIRFGGIDSVFNKGILILFLLTPFTKRMRSQKQFRILYFVHLVHFGITFLASPQFRFFLPEFVFLTLILAEDYANRLHFQPKTMQPILILAVILPFFQVYLSDHLQPKRAIFPKSEGAAFPLLLPRPNSGFEGIGFDTFTEGNLKYHSPHPNFFFYGTANGALPCTNVKIIRRFKRKYNFVPQLRTGLLKDGFCSKKTGGWISRN